MFCFGMGFKMELALRSETLAGQTARERRENFRSENSYEPLSQPVLRNSLAGLFAVGRCNRNLTAGAFARNRARYIATQWAQVGANDLDWAVRTLHAGDVPQNDLLGQLRGFQQIGHVHAEFSQHAIG